MQFYEEIAAHYDLVFPYAPSQKDFTLTAVSKSGLTPPFAICETGCGSGSLALALAAEGHTVEASDYDPGMVSLCLKKRGDSDNPSFRRLDMKLAAEVYPRKNFDAVCCYGNTLVHLGDPGEVRVFFSAALKILKPGSPLCLQILNYDHILGNASQSTGFIDRLPLIENGGVRFERFYDRRADGRLDFRTELTTPEGKKLSHSIPLYPLRKNELEKALRESGFREIRHYAGFGREEFKQDSMVLVTEAW